MNGIAGIFYVGKGSGGRAWQLGERRSEFWGRVFKKHGMEVQVAAHWGTAEEAFEHEKFLISVLREMGAPLVNQTSGGDGCNLTDEVLARRSDSIREAYKCPELRAKIGAKVKEANTPEVLKKRADSLRAAHQRPEVRSRAIERLNKLRSDPGVLRLRLQNIAKTASTLEYKAKKRAISLANGNRPPAHSGSSHPMARAVVCVENGLVFGTSVMAAEWLRSQGVPAKAGKSAIYSACSGRSHTAYGFTWAYAK